MTQTRALFLAFCAALCGYSQDFDALLRRGIELHGEQQYSQSIRALKRARAVHPSDYSVNLLLGIDFLRSGQLRRALPYFESAHKIDSTQAEPLGYEAEAYAALGEFDRTADILRGLAERSGEAIFSLVRFYVRRFSALAEEMRTTNAGLARAYRLEAVALHQRRDPKERDALLRVQALMPESPGIESALGKELLQESRFEEAAREFSRALARDSGDLDALAGTAVLAARNGELAEAKRLLTLLSQQSPHRLAAAYREWPHTVPLTPELILKVADDGTVELVGTAPRDATPVASFRFGAALARLERWEEAIAPLERSARDKDLRLDSAYWLSLCYSRSAEQRTAQLSSKSGNGRWLSAVRGEVLLRLVHDGPAATAEFANATALAPADPELRTGLAEAQLLAGETAAARDSALKALELDPLRGPAMRAFAEAAMQERDYAAAIPVLEKLLAIHESDIAAQVLLGTAYARTRSADRAAHYLRKVLDQGYPDEKGTVALNSGHRIAPTRPRSQLGREEEPARLFQQAQALSDAFTRSTAKMSR